MGAVGARGPLDALAQAAAARRAQAPLLIIIDDFQEFSRRDSFGGMSGGGGAGAGAAGGAAGVLKQGLLYYITELVQSAQNRVALLALGVGRACLEPLEKRVRSRTSVAVPGS